MNDQSTTATPMPAPEHETSLDGAQDAAPDAPSIIARRKTCDAEGTGLSHYILMDRQVDQ